jgi:indole-3-glycerol phosphate synthase
VGFLTDLVGEIRDGLVRSPLDAAALTRRAAEREPARGFAAALRAGAARDGVAVIAEVKRSSPSAGPIADADAAEQARAYVDGGAAAISVLTQARHFGGAVDDLAAVRDAIPIPVLRKDFLVDGLQVLEARAAGADAVLLIAAALGDEDLRVLLAAAAELGMDAVVEAVGAEDLERALGCGAEVIGVNARDLETLEVDPERALELLGRIPSDRVAVLESGIASRDHVERAVAAGASAVLVGEALMRAPDPRVQLRALLGREAAYP